MTTTYSNNLALTLIGTGDQTGTWGDTTNTNLGTLVEQAISGYTTVNFASGTYAVTLTMDNGVSCSARNMCLEVSNSNPSGDTTVCTLTVPAKPKIYILKYSDSWASNQYYDLQGVMYLHVNGSAAAPVQVPFVYDAVADLNVPFAAMFFCDGTNIIPISTNLANPPDIGTESPRLVHAAGGTMSNMTFVAPGISGGNADDLTIGTVTPGLGVFSKVYTPVIVEKGTSSATAATGTVTLAANTTPVTYYTANASGNWVVNITLSSMLSTNGWSCSVAFLVTQGTTAYYNTSVQVDGTTSGVTTKWQGGSAPTAGSPSGIDVYTYTVIRTAASTYTVLASVVPFA
jgi:hypothetical protein